MHKQEQQFEELSREEILAIRPGRWDDYELLSVVQMFEKQKDWRRSAAILELILRSPEHSEMVEYEEVYSDLLEYYRHTAKDFRAALRWAHAVIAYSEQHAPGENRFNHWRDLADTYWQAGDIDTGLAMYARILRADPGDIWTYNALSRTLGFAGYPKLELEVLDQAPTMVRRGDPEKISDQLQRFHDEATQKLREMGDNLGQISAVVLADFREALALWTGLAADQADGRPVKPAGLERSPYGEVVAQPYLPPLDRLLTLGQAEDAALFAEIVEQGKVLAPELIRMAFDSDLHEAAGDEARSFGPSHAVALLRRLRPVVELDELSLWLDQAEGDWYHELLSSSCGKIGGYTREALQALAADTGYSVSVRSAATTALVERVNRFSEHQEAVVEFFRELLNRPEARERAEEETFIGFLISDILDMEGGRALYPDIKQAYEEDRVDTSIVELVDVHDEWKLKPISRLRRRDDGLYLLLTCRECGRTREHFVQHVLIDATTLTQSQKGEAPEFSPYIMDRKIICPKCGAVDRYELAPQAHLALIDFSSLEASVEMMAGKKPSRPLKSHPRVHTNRFSALGQFMHPFAALDEYRRHIAADPNNGKLYEGLGNILRSLNRAEEALEVFQQGCQVAPDSSELAVSLAMCAHDLGDKKTAKDMYERAIELATPRGLDRLLPLGDSRRQELKAIAVSGLERLRLRQSSPWAMPWEEEEEQQRARPVRPGQSRRPKKKKRKRR